MPTSSLSVRGVHLDLKGVPPTIDRMIRLLSVAAAAGYNAALVEWEDMFPWTVDRRFRATYAFSQADVAHIHSEAARVGIEIIPLVQCLGHMETPLSVPDYAPLREIPQLANVLNPMAPGARELIEKMVDDVLSIGQKPRWFHLGGDEAWSFGRSEAEKKFIAEHGGPGALYLHHVEPILDKLIARGIRPILWHDMMSRWEVEALPRIAAKADLMVWGYGEHPDVTKHHYRTEVIERFYKHNVPMWGACAYKGGDGGAADLPTLKTRRDNSLAWTDVGKRYGLIGVVATAWSRYTTHRVQCEPIDGALDVLVAVGQILKTGEAGLDLRDDALKIIDQIGERPIFDACYAALKELQQCREGAWSSIRELREQIPLAKRDPKRNHSGMASEPLYHAIRWTIGGDKAAAKFREAFRGLLPEASIEEYLAVRLEPLHEQTSELVKIVAQFEPGPWSHFNGQLKEQGIAV